LIGSLYSFHKTFRWGKKKENQEKEVEREQHYMSAHIHSNSASTLPSPQVIDYPPEGLPLYKVGEYNLNLLTLQKNMRKNRASSFSRFDN